MDIRRVLRPWILVLPAALCLLAACGRDEPGGLNQAEVERELEAAGRAARDYFEAEVRRDHEAVFRMLAPGSKFRMSYTPEQYRLMAADGPLSIRYYEIQNVGPLDRDVDRQAYPTLELTVPVKVQVGVYDRQTGETVERSTVFIFVKENGVWYKG